MKIESVVTRRYADFQGIVEELTPELGEHFPYALQQWCGIAKTPSTSQNWRVFLAKTADTHSLVGIYSLYQHPTDPPYRFWVGWFGVVAAYRRQGLGTAFLHRVVEQVKALGGTELWVYTDHDDRRAILFYQAFGLKIWGQFKDVEAEQAAAEDNSVVLWMELTPSAPGAS